MSHCPPQALDKIVQREATKARLAARNKELAREQLLRAQLLLVQRVHRSETVKPK